MDDFEKLMRAIKERNALQISTLLSEKKFDLDRKDPQGNYPLMLALKYGLANAAKKMIELGADINCVDQEGSTPIFKAVESSTFLELLPELLKRNCNTHLKNAEGRYPFMHALLNHAPQKIILQLMSNHSLDETDNYGNTPLMMAVSSYNISMADNLIKKGANLHAKNRFGLDAFDFAKNWESPLMTEFLLSQGAKEHPTRAINIRYNLPLSGDPHSPIDILRSHTFVQNPIRNNAPMNEVFDNIERCAEQRIELILSFVALKILRENNIGKNNFEIRATNLPTIESLDGTHASGAFDYKRDKILVANIENKHKAGMTLLHEMIHMIRRSRPKKDYTELFHAQQKVYENLRLAPQIKTTQFIEKQILERAEYSYPIREDILEENIADLATAIMYARRNVKGPTLRSKKAPEEDRMVYEIMEPYFRYFDLKLVPFLTHFITKTPEVNVLKLSEDLVNIHHQPYISKKASNIALERLNEDSAENKHQPGLVKLCNTAPSGKKAKTVSLKRFENPVKFKRFFRHEIKNSILPKNPSQTNIIPTTIRPARASLSNQPKMGMGFHFIS